MNLGKVIWRTNLDLGLAFAIGAVIALPFFLFGASPHHDRYNFSALPDDDHSLERWFREQSEAGEVTIAREQGILEVNYRSTRRFSSLLPPWKDLGYTGLRSATFSSEFMPFSISKSIFIVILGGQVGFLSVGLWRIRRSIRGG